MNQSGESIVFLDKATVAMIRAIDYKIYDQKGYDGLEICVDEEARIVLSFLFQTGQPDITGIEQEESLMTKINEAHPEPQPKPEIPKLPKPLPVKKATEPSGPIPALINSPKKHYGKKFNQKKWQKVADLVNAGDKPYDAYKKIYGYGTSKEYIIATLKEHKLVDFDLLTKAEKKVFSELDEPDTKKENGDLVIEKKAKCTYCDKTRTYRGLAKDFDPKTFVCEPCLLGEPDAPDEEDKVDDEA